MLAYLHTFRIHKIKKDGTTQTREDKAVIQITSQSSKWFSILALSLHTVAHAHCVCHGAKLSCQAESQKCALFLLRRKRDYFENVPELGGNIGFSGWQAESFPWWEDISRSLARCCVFRWQTGALVNRELLKQLGHKLWRQDGGVVVLMKSVFYWHALCTVVFPLSIVVFPRRDLNKRTFLCYAAKALVFDITRA